MQKEVLVNASEMRLVNYYDKMVENEREIIVQRILSRPMGIFNY